MKIIYSVCEITTTEVCIPLDNYYGRSGDWHQQELATLRPVEEFSEEQNAIEYIDKKCLYSTSFKAEYTILKTYKA